MIPINFKRYLLCNELKIITESKIRNGLRTSSSQGLTHLNEKKKKREKIKYQNHTIEYQTNKYNKQE